MFKYKVYLNVEFPSLGEFITIELEHELDHYLESEDFQMFMAIPMGEKGMLGAIKWDDISVIVPIDEE